jgi:hypothetical protein
MLFNIIPEFQRVKKAIFNAQRLHHELSDEDDILAVHQSSAGELEEVEESPEPEVITISNEEGEIFAFCLSSLMNVESFALSQFEPLEALLPVVPVYGSQANY